MERLHRAASCAISSRLLSCPILLFLSEAHLPPLQVTQTYFVLSSYDRAFRLPTFFPISGLVILGVKLRLCLESFCVHLHTHPFCYFSLAGSLCLPSSHPWSRSFFTVDSTLPSPCSRSDPSLSCKGAALAYLDSLSSPNMAIRTDCSVPFPFGKRGSGLLVYCSCCGTEATLSFSGILIASVFPLNSAPFCKLFDGLGSTNKSVSSLLLLSDSHSVHATLFSLPSFLLPQSSG